MRRKRPIRILAVSALPRLSLRFARLGSHGERQRQGDKHCGEHDADLPIESELFLAFSLQC